MINLYFNIRNPFRGGSDATPHDYVCRDWTVAENKSIELQISKFSRALDLFEIRVGTNFSGEDHAGPHLEITLWKFYFAVKLYDHRHWDYDAHAWEVYRPEQEPDAQADRYVDARMAYEAHVVRRAPSFGELSAEEQQKWLQGHEPK